MTTKRKANLPDIQTVPEHYLVADIRKQDRIITLLDLAFGALLGLVMVLLYFYMVEIL